GNKQNLNRTVGFASRPQPVAQTPSASCASVRARAQGRYPGLQAKSQVRPSRDQLSLSLAALYQQAEGILRPNWWVKLCRTRGRDPHSDSRPGIVGSGIAV